MPTKCSVSSCDNYYSKGAPFFDVPSPVKYKFSSEKAKLSKKRRKLWLHAMGITNDPSNILRICSNHFITGKPATLEDINDDDWIPTLHMKSSSSIHRKRKRDSYPLKLQGNAATSNKQYAGKISGTHGKTELVKKDSRKTSKRIELKRFLNCKVLLDGNIQSTTFKGTNGSGLTIAQKHGKFTSDNVTVKETALNNTVLRIHLIREDLCDLKRRYQTFSSPGRKKEKKRVSSFGRQIKRKINFFEDYLPLRKRVDIKNTTNSVQSAKTDRQMRNGNVKEDKPFLINNKLYSRNQLVKNISENSSKTLKRVIRKHYRDKIKIKLFPKVTPTVARAINNGTLIAKSDKSRQLHREILFVKNLKNNQQWSESNEKCFLKFSPYRYPDDGTLDYSFQKLVTDVKHMKLPAPSWKIKVIIRQGKISAVTFTNKLTPERCVGFSANCDKYKITIDNRPALLLGSPNHVKTSEDLEILLNIVQEIDSKNPMVFYK